MIGPEASPPRRLSRRRVVRAGLVGAVAAPRGLRGGLLGGLLGGSLAGCGTARPIFESDDRPDPDTRLLGEMISQIDATSSLLAQLRQREPALRGSLAALADTHVVHRARLSRATNQAPTARGGGARLPRQRPAAVDVVRRRELALQRQLAEAAGQAESGGFARMLASMSASLGQHLSPGYTAALVAESASDS